MPILAKEPDIYPDGLLDGPVLLTPDESWYAMYTLARHEKELMRLLRPLNISHYAPMVQHRNRSPKGRIRTSYVPLFSGYVFVRGDEVSRHNAVSTGCISRCLPVKEGELLVRDLLQIRMMLQSGGDVAPEPRPVVGRKAVVRNGAMKGLKGVVTRMNSQHRLTVMVTFMQQGASVVVDEADVELL
jgi:transcriptional antiterminator RfaH